MIKISRIRTNTAKGNNCRQRVAIINCWRMALMLSKEEI